MKKSPTQKTKTILITGVAGFIGFHLAQRLLKKGARVVGIDSMNEYYDPKMKLKRLSLLKKYPTFTFSKVDISDYKALERVGKKEAPSEIIHLAAQAGVRYSLTNPWEYSTANYLGTLNVFEMAKRLGISRVAYASSSSVYGTNTKTPFKETDRVDTPVSLYAATKKANEVLAHSYAHLYGMEMVGLRFFTVYGEWGRPDMALFKFVRAILEGKPIAVYNNGKMKRSFTHVSDITAAIETLIKKPHVSRHAIYNLGGKEAVPLMTFITLIEKNLGRKATYNMLPMQPGDVASTVADCSSAERDLGFSPRMSIEKGIREFTTWYVKNARFLSTLKEPKQ